MWLTWCNKRLQLHPRVGWPGPNVVCKGTWRLRRAGVVPRVQGELLGTRPSANTSEVLQCFLHMPQIDFAVGTAERTTKA